MVPTGWPSAEWSLGFGSWFNNFFCSGAENYKPKDLATIKCPYTEYFIFSFIKSMQISSFLAAFIRPAYNYYLYSKIKPKDVTNNTDKIVTAALRRMQGRMLIGGMFASPLLFATSIYYNNYTREKLVNRCYEIRRDEDILSYDRTTLAFGAIGWYWKRIQGAVDGINLALLYAVFHHHISKKYLNPITPDVLTLLGKEKYETVEDAEFGSQKLFQFIKKKLEERAGKNQKTEKEE
uniref:Uncharacterized protein n=1 Tax=Meloidogyne enterolobii TaxID=390850 RepID=A0A6V7WXC0_MELEN|nr:unnamed protein product [Meloidogyne enterolobii]